MSRNLCTFLLSLLLLAILLPFSNSQTYSWQVISAKGSYETRAEAAFSKCSPTTYCLVGGRKAPPTSIYDTTTRTWSEASAPSIELHHYQAVHYNNCSYAFGAWTEGYPNEVAVKDVYRFCEEKGDWEKSDIVMPEGRERGAGASVVVGNKVYVVGGNVGGHGKHARLFEGMDVYDFESGEWEVLEDMPNPRDHFGCVEYKGTRLVCAGGRETTVDPPEFFKRNVAEVDVYDLESGKWSTLKGKVPTPRAGTMIGMVDGLVFLAGGEGDGEAYDLVEILDVEKETWSGGPNMNSKRHGTGIITDGNKMFVAAGAGKQGEGDFATTLETLVGNEGSDGDGVDEGGPASPGASPSEEEGAAPDGATPSPNEADTGESPSPTDSDINGVTPAGDSDANTESPDVSPTPTADDSTRRDCFPATAQVQLFSGETKTMEQLEIGDVVRAGSNSFSKVFFFTHRDQDAKSTFINISTAKKNALKLSAGHYLYVNGKLTAARNVKIGDSIHIIDPDVDVPQAFVTSISRSVERGLYNPHTVHGDVVVDGVRASTFTEAVEPTLANTLLTPLKWLHAGLQGSKSGPMYEALNRSILKIFELTVWGKH